MRIREPQCSGYRLSCLQCGNPSLLSSWQYPQAESIPSGSVWGQEGWLPNCCLEGEGRLGIACLLPWTFQTSSLFSVPPSLLLLFKALVLPVPEAFQDSARHFHQCPLQPSLPTCSFSSLVRYLPLLLFVFIYYGLGFQLPPNFFQDISGS